MLSVSDNPGKSPVFYKIQRDDGTVTCSITTLFLPNTPAIVYPLLN